ncbi:MAG: FtsX-like permease family protein [bacterium]
MIFKIAFKNVLSAGIRTWLNTVIISITLTAIILIQGMNNGLLKELMTNRINEELGNGQFWHVNYDPFDPLTLEKSHGELSPAMAAAVKKREAIPILMVAGSAYPQGRIFPAVLKGIPVDQQILQLPFEQLQAGSPPGTIPAMIGKNMARRTQLSRGDIITVRWRNSQGAFNATDLAIVHVFNGRVPSMDQGQIWLPLKNLQAMNLSPNHATIIISARPVDDQAVAPEWIRKTLDDLLADTYQLVQNKSVGAGIFYLILIFLAMIAIFDTQALSIFKRRREIGTLMALGMTNRAIVWTFTMEGLLHGVFATVLTAVTGAPLFWYFQTRGYSIPISGEDYGMAISEHLYADFSPALILGTLVIVMLLITIVSYLPARKITHLQPFVALRGKWS